MPDIHSASSASPAIPAGTYAVDTEKSAVTFRAKAFGLIGCEAVSRCGRARSRSAAAASPGPACSPPIGSIPHWGQVIGTCGPRTISTRTRPHDRSGDRRCRLVERFSCV